jgi:hypothetical protein
VDPSLPSIYNNTVRVCNTLADLTCIVSSRKSFFSESSSQTDECAAVCPEECEAKSFELMVSNSRYPTTYNINYMKKQTNISAKLKASNSNDNNIPKTTLIVNIFFSGTASP